MDIIQLLQKTFVFRDLPQEELKKLSAILHRRVFGAGDFFFEEGEPSKTMYIIEEGMVQITKKVNQENKALNTLQSGDLFGEMAFIEQKPRSASARASAAGIIWSMTAVDFANVLKSFHSAAVVKLMIKFLQVMSQRLRETTDQVKSLV
ncbi:MAG: Crp/Fnr family transcriptional regulator [Elusimicrobia bacterium]|nr:Crp/Fnr family transcriptional regulator [Elusimicrobiota bacterium]